MPRVDLHVHSTASDGECAPAEVARRARAAGLDVIALTDHDTMAGVAEARAAGEAVGVRVVSGCEFSVRVPWGEMHLLAYFLPVGQPELEEFLAGQRRARSARMDEIVRRLVHAGVAIERTHVERAAAGGSLGRPHAARALVELGVVPDLNAAFHRYLRAGRSAYVPKRLPPVEEVTTLVRRTGGVSAAAHLRDRGGHGALEVLQQAGVDGVEARHPAHDAATAARIERAAAALDMVLTGGSDWHGGTHEGDPHRAALGAVDVPPAWFENIEHLHEHRMSAEVTL